MLWTIFQCNHDALGPLLHLDNVAHPPLSCHENCLCLDYWSLECREDMNSSLSSSKGRSPSDMVHDSSIFLASFQGESMEVCRSSCEYRSYISSSSIISGEVEMFLTTPKICSYWEDEIPANTRIWERSFKLLIIVESHQLVGGFMFHTWISIVTRVPTTPQKWFFFKSQDS